MRRGGRRWQSGRKPEADDEYSVSRNQAVTGCDADGAVRHRTRGTDGMTTSTTPLACCSAAPADYMGPYSAVPASVAATITIFLFRESGIARTATEFTDDAEQRGYTAVLRGIPRPSAHSVAHDTKLQSARSTARNNLKSIDSPIAL